MPHDLFLEQGTDPIAKGKPGKHKDWYQPRTRHSILSDYIQGYLRLRVFFAPDKRL
jgi:hypothetical protein